MSLNRRSAMRGTALGVAGALLLALVPSQGRSDYLSQPVRRYTGFTRPGSPPDQEDAEGKAVPAAVGGEAKQDALGGTIYFAVFERNADRADKEGKESKRLKGDTFGTGIENFDTLFHRGREVE